MNEDQFKGKWKQAKGKLKQKYADLTDDDLMYTGKDQGTVEKGNRRYVIFHERRNTVPAQWPGLFVLGS
jgi:uncharacterized protein YjbJ (UPF0337 family)